MKVSPRIHIAIALLCTVGVAVALWFIDQGPKRSAADSVRDIYSELYHQNSNLSSLGRADDIYSSTLLNLINKEQQRQIESGELGKLSADPLCNCQDPASVEIIEIKDTATEDDHVSVQVHISVSGISQRLSLELLKESGAWKVADIANDDIPSLLDFLK